MVRWGGDAVWVTPIGPGLAVRGCVDPGLHGLAYDGDLVRPPTRMAR